MAIPLTGTGGLFTRLGLDGGILNSINTYRGTTLPGKVDTFSNQFDSDKDYIDSLYSYLAGMQGAMSALPSAMQAIAQVFLTEMANLDNPQPTKTYLDAIRELIRQMSGTADSINASTVAASVAAASNIVGTGKCIATVRRVCDVKAGQNSPTCENAFAEDIVVDCTADSYDGSLTANSESFLARGEFPQEGSLRWDWPRGSGSNLQLTVVDPSLDAQETGQQLTNGDMEAFTANVPDNWAIVVGTAGSTVLSTATAYRGSKALAFTGDGVEVTRIRQKTNDAAGTTAIIQPQTIYAFHVRMRLTSGLIGGGITFSLTDASGTVIQDDLFNSCATTVLYSDLSTSYAAFTGAWVTPRVLPSTIYFDIRASSALTNTKSAYMDDIVLAPMDELYTDGPSLKVVAGATAFALEDRFTVTITNTPGGFQRLFDRLFDMRGNRLLIPSDPGGFETISDALIS